MADRRWRRRVRAGMAVVVVLGLAAGGLSVSGAWLARTILGTPDTRDALLERVFDGRGVRVEYRSIDVVENDRWEVLLDGVTVETATAQVAIGHVACGIPGLWSMLLGRVELGVVRVDGLQVTVPERPLPRERSAGGLPLRVVVDALLVRDGRLHMPAIGDLPELRVEGLRAELSDVVIVAGAGVVSGHGSLALRTWESGRVRVSSARFEAVRLSRHTHVFGAGQLQVAGGGAAGTVEIGALQSIRPTVHAELQLRDGDLATLVQTITGRTSPMTGRLSGAFSVDAGGALGPGQSRTHAEVELADGALLLGDTASPVLRAALKLAPFIELQHGQVRFGPIRAALVLTPGVVEVERFVHEGKHRPLTARGRIVGRTLDLVLRLVPKRGADRRSGLGLVISGEAGALQVRRASAAELADLDGVR